MTSNREILRLLDENSHVLSYEVLDFRENPDSFFLKLKVEFTDHSSLFTKEYFSKTVRNYSFHWQDINDNLLIRWDNAPFHKSIDTFPHHKHKDNKVISSMEIGLEDVLKYIFEMLAG
jgi:hypothetical protein